MAGRPTKRQQEKMEQTVIKWYVSGLSATQIINKTKYSKNTVYSYIKDFQKKRKTDSTFEKNLSQIVDHANLAFDQRLEKSLQIESEIEKLCKKYQNPPLKLLFARAKISKQITELLDVKFDYVTKVGMDELLVGEHH